jgi:hypothetical protein
MPPLSPEPLPTFVVVPEEPFNEPQPDMSNATTNIKNAIMLIFRFMIYSSLDLYL